MEAVRMILKQMKLEGFESRSLIGFSAAPWTILFFMVGSSFPGRQGEGQRWLKEYPEASKELLTLLTQVIVEYLSAQARAGCHALQVFEAMGEHVSEEDFWEFAYPALTEIARQLRERHPGIPLMVFPRGACYALTKLQTAGYDVVTADTSVDMAEAAKALREEAASSGSSRIATLQGNFNPVLLRPAEGRSPEAVRNEVRAMLEATGSLGPSAPRLIANIGEGLNGQESPELVKAFVDAVHELSTP
eukprot:gnl/TRDRNA2_/TRDRNA2_94031_c0_seq2.p1 gnl/TRDRNA2_/TRDRNA2_94031_c0~~gnl/TRDRNA2_/TRDRNA2_94031_c0_seq2.p1  ORF type:complete len:247 (+),score=39.86 gnl/TRDRNA2_/TRDRNA2_94031_c0_seq2:244-984(+)